MDREVSELDDDATTADKIKDVARDKEREDARTLREAKRTQADESNPYPHRLRD